LTAGQRPPGVSVVVDDDGMPWSDGFGFTDVEAGRPATADTVYLWFSMTKAGEATIRVVVELPPDSSPRLRTRLGVRAAQVRAELTCRADEAVIDVRTALVLVDSSVSTTLTVGTPPWPPE
jgi:hypothetical protein